MERAFSPDIYLTLAMLESRWQEVSKSLPSDVHLLAVSKGHGFSSVKLLADLGQRDFGESRLQEAIPKLQKLRELKQLRWHFIGRLQSNKVRSVLKLFQYIHSVDSLALAKRISRISLEEKCFPEIFLQVKFREDPKKSGFEPEELISCWSALKELSNLKIIGLMTMSPMHCASTQRKHLFRDCRNLANQLELPHCSMGMSGDWEDALEEGATWLRLGSILFGIPSNR